MLLVEMIRKLTGRLDDHFCTRLRVDTQESGLKKEAIAEAALVKEFSMQTASSSNTLESQQDAIVASFEQLSIQGKQWPRDLKQLLSMMSTIDMPHLKNIDSTMIRANKAWGKLLLQPLNDFENDLKGPFHLETLERKKMLILARFKRHLLVIALYAENVLSQETKENISINDNNNNNSSSNSNTKDKNNASGGKNNKKTKESGTISDNTETAVPVVAKEIHVTEGIDEWMVARVNESAAETQRLLEEALNQSTVTVNAGAPLSIGNNKGESEILVLSCVTTILKFNQFCISADAERKVVHGSMTSMVDVHYKNTSMYFGKELKQQPPSICTIHQHVIDYLAKHLFELAYYEAYQQYGLSLYSWSLYSVDVANKKCEHLRGALVDFDRASTLAHNDLTTENYYEELFKKLHAQREAGIKIGENPYLPSFVTTVGRSYLGSAIGSYIGLKPTTELEHFYKLLHQDLAYKAPVSAEEIAKKHRECPW